MAFLVLILAAIVALTTACGGNDTGGGSPSTSVELTPDPTTYTAPPTEKTGQTGGENTKTTTGGTVLKIGGPNVENRNRSTPWPRIPMDSGAKTDGYGCSERYNTQATIPVTIKDIQISAPFRIVQEWEICKEYAQGNRGCKGRTLPPETNAYEAKTPGCALVIKVGKFTGQERAGTLTFTFEAKCTAAKGTPCDKVPAGRKLPATVTWTASETVTAGYKQLPVPPSS